MPIIRKAESASSTERLIVKGLIVSKEYASQVAPVLDTDLLDSRFIKTVVTWCLNYFQEFKKAPGKTIEDIYRSKSDKLDDESRTAISTMLTSLSDEFDNEKELNYRYYCIQTEKYLDKQKLKRLSEKIKIEVSQDNISEAKNAITNYSQVRVAQSEGVDLFKDREKIKSLLNRKESDVIFHFPGALGNVIADCARGEFVAFTAPEKRGKSWWLQESSLWSLLAGKSTVVFNLEMLESQVIMRLAQRLTGQPLIEKNLGCPVPYLDRDGKTVRTRKSTKKLLTPAEADKKIASLFPLVRGARYKFICWPPSSHSLADVKQQLHIWEQEDGYIPDTVIVDHADRLVPERKYTELRHGIDSIWEGLKGLAIEKSCLVLSATHSKLASARKRITEETATAEDKRKAGHVDRMIALNQTIQEARDGLMRVNVIYERNASAHRHLDVMVLQQLAIGHPYLGSFVEENDRS